jgi:ribonuclease HI
LELVPNIIRWEAPPPELFKVNWDVAFSQGDKQMGVGVIIRDWKGEVIAALSQPVMATYDPVSAESMAALRAVEFCSEVGINDFILEGDSLLVVKAVNESNLGWLPYGQIIEDIHCVLGTRRQWHIRHVKREANSAAHGLAKFASRTSDLIVWMEESPSCILDIVILEQLALSL